MADKTHTVTLCWVQCITGDREESDRQVTKQGRWEERQTKRDRGAVQYNATERKNEERERKR